MRARPIPRAWLAVAGPLVVVAACGGQEPPAQAPPPPPAAKDPPALASIATACARVSACSRIHDPARFRDPGACVDWWISEPEASGKNAEPLRRCLADARSCDAVSTCMHGGGDARAAAFCAQRAGVVSGCDGERLVTCGEDDAHESSVVDCAAIGASCREVKSTGGLVVRACWSAQKCPAGAPETRCDGAGAITSCHDGAFERMACGAGTSCAERKDENGDVVASCELPGRRGCDLRQTRRCEDGRLVECTRTGAHGTELHVTDCVGAGLRCGGVGPRARCSVPAEIECDKERLPTCAGDAVVFCAAGRLAKVACRSVGLGGCDPSAKGAIAACAPAPGTATLPTAPAGTTK